MTQFLTADTLFPSYLVFPRFLMAMELPETAKLLYMVLLDRARLSMRNEGWIDENGCVFLYFTISGLADELNKGETTIKTNLRKLEDADLIFRRRQGIGRPNRIYIKIPSEKEEAKDRKLPDRGAENCLSKGQITAFQKGGKLSPIKNNERNNRKGKQESKGPHAFGSYQNVFLTAEEMDDLERTVPRYEDYIEQLSSYMESTGIKYWNHAATIRRWALKDAPESKKRHYDIKEGDSL